MILKKYLGELSCVSVLAGLLLHLRTFPAKGGKVEIEYPQVMEKSEIPIGLFKTADVTISVLYTEVPHCFLAFLIPWLHMFVTFKNLF
jgi:hypothetical protein